MKRRTPPDKEPEPPESAVDQGNSRGPTPPQLATLFAALVCPLCHLSLRCPTTLACGHSLCAFHVTDLPDLNSDSPAKSSDPPAKPSDSPAKSLLLPRCPLPGCSASTPRRSSVGSTISTSSRVRYRPAPATDDAALPIQPRTVPDPRPDVSLNKVLSLVRHAKQALEASSDDGRPRKRQRQQSPDDDDDDLPGYVQRLASPSPSDGILSRFQKNLLAELTCEICFVLLYQPITTPCQHTFCATCLQRSLDHSSACPLCRHDLPGLLYFHDHPSNKTLLAIILHSFPMFYKERAEALAAQERDARLDTPIFVCQLSFPGMPTLLHFFEPRYRLMLRRCLESPSPRFGMIMPPKPGAGSPLTEYGTMLEIRSVQMLSDGRSMVETWGSFRFRLLERGTLDGYMVGRIERIDDYPEDLSASSLLCPLPLSPTPTPSSSSAPPPLASSNPTTPTTTPTPVPIHPSSPSNQDLMSTCRSFLDRLREGTAPWVVQRLSNTVGTMPTDPSAFSFWVALVLPIDEYEKAKLLPLRSARLRLLLLVHWIEQLNSQCFGVLTFSRFCGFT
ncbi:hypothetical protein Ac2012v2_004219 [Leucoagaricus gongylophorus]